MSTQRQRCYSWSDRWEGHFESRLSLMWKFAWVNAQRRAQMRWRFDTTRINDGMHSYDFPYTYKPNFREPRETLPFERERVVQTIEEYCGALTPLLVTESSLRFCPVCLQYGYVSVFFQLACLRLCPMHAVPLEETCKCGAATPGPDAFGRGLDAPFHCITCGKPLAGEFNPNAFFEAPRMVHALEGALVPLANWIGSLRRSRWDLEHSIAWPSGFATQETYLRHFVHWVLQSIKPLRLAPCYLNGSGWPLCRSVFREVAKRQSLPFHSTVDADEAAINRAVKRHVEAYFLRSMLLLTPMGGWHHVLGETMIVSGIVGMVIATIGALRREHGHR